MSLLVVIKFNRAVCGISNHHLLHENESQLEWRLQPGWDQLDRTDTFDCQLSKPH